MGGAASAIQVALIDQFGGYPDAVGRLDAEEVLEALEELAGTELVEVEVADDVVLEATVLEDAMIAVSVYTQLKNQ